MLRMGDVELDPTLAGDDKFQQVFDTTGEGLVQAFVGTGMCRGSKWVTETR